MKTHYLTIGKNTGKYKLYYFADTTGQYTWDLFSSKKEIQEYENYCGWIGGYIKIMLKSPFMFPGTQKDRKRWVNEEICHKLQKRGVMKRGKLYGDDIYFLSGH